MADPTRGHDADEPGAAAGEAVSTEQGDGAAAPTSGSVSDADELAASPQGGAATAPKEPATPQAPLPPPTAFPAGVSQTPFDDGDHPPPFDDEHVPCLRGPCAHLLMFFTHFPHSNGPVEKQPRERHMYCMRNAGVELPLTADAPVVECNQWLPMGGRHHEQRNEAQQRWHADHKRTKRRKEASDDNDNA